MGTMPHALIGYAGSTVRAAEMMRETYPNEGLTVLVDYFGREVTDAIACAQRFPDLAADGRLAVRVDTPGSRYVEGLDPPTSYAVLERHCPQAIRGYRNETELRHLVGAGVSAAAIHHLRDGLDRPAFPGEDRGVVRLRAGKCKMMAEAGADRHHHRLLSAAALDRNLRRRRHRL
jgi:nicotinate phosphoribosyltransferase